MAGFLSVLNSYVLSFGGIGRLSQYKQLGQNYGAARKKFWEVEKGEPRTTVSA